jgi:hypothetical protein
MPAAIDRPHEERNSTPKWGAGYPLLCDVDLIIRLYSNAYCAKDTGRAKLRVPLATRDGSSLTAEAAATGSTSAAAMDASRPAIT